MKLVIKESCIVSGGVIKERGQIYSTKEQNPKQDSEAFALIATGRAVVADSEEGRALLSEIAAEAPAEPVKSTKK